MHSGTVFGKWLDLGVRGRALVRGGGAGLCSSLPVRLLTEPEAAFLPPGPPRWRSALEPADYGAEQLQTGTNLDKRSNETLAVILKIACFFPSSGEEDTDKL